MILMFDGFAHVLRMSTYRARTFQNTFRSNKDSGPNNRPHNNGDSIKQSDSSLQLYSIIRVPLIRRRLLLRHRFYLSLSLSIQCVRLNCEQAFSLPPEVNNMDYTILEKGLIAFEKI